MSKRKYLVYDSRACGGPAVTPRHLPGASCLAMGDSDEEARDFVREHDLKACACFSYPVKDHPEGEEEGPPIIQGEARWKWDYHRTTGFLTKREEL